MIYNLKQAQRIFLGSQEVSQILLQNFQIFSSISADLYSDYVTLLTHFNTDFSDSSTNNFELTAFGNAQIDTSVKKFGSGSAYFDGNGDYLEVPYSVVLDYGLDDFTVEFWVRFNSTNDTQGLICGSVNNSMDIQLQSDGDLAIGNHFVSWEHEFPWGPSINTWYHVAISRSSGNTKAFIDGQQIGTTKNDSAKSYSMLGGNMVIGQGDGPLNGYIDELRITKGIARYTSNFVPQTAPFANP